IVDATRGDSLEPETLETVLRHLADRRSKNFYRDRMVQEDVLPTIDRAEVPPADLLRQSILVIQHRSRERLRQSRKDQLRTLRRSERSCPRLGEHSILCHQLLIRVKKLG